MTIREKLEFIQKTLGLTQTKLADRFGVSFVAFNSWWKGKSMPRPKMQVVIDDLFLELTGQKAIDGNRLSAKKQALIGKASSHGNVVSEIVANPDIRDEFALKLTYNSNSIEGSTLSEADTSAILFDDITLPNRSLTEHLEAKNHQTAVNHLFEYVANGGGVDERLVLDLHGILMSGIMLDAGQYRRHAVRIVGADVPTANYLKVPELMSNLMRDVRTGMRNEDNDIIRLSARTHGHFEQIHPFSDGNGRVGRLLMNAMLLRVDLPPAVILQQRKRLYCAYLNRAQIAGDYGHLEDFICDAVAGGFEVLERTDISQL